MANLRGWRQLDGSARSDSATLCARDAEVGKFLRVQISYVDGQGNPEMMISPMSQPVRNVNDKPMGRPELRGEAKENST